MATLTPASDTARAAAAAFVGRAAQLDPTGPVRLLAGTTAPGRTTVDIWIKAGFGVLATMTIDGRLEPDGTTVYAADLVAALAVSTAEHLDPGGDIGPEWHAPLPPADGWTDVGRLPVWQVVDQVRAATGVAIDAAERERAGEMAPATKATVPPALLDSTLLTVPSGDRRVPISMRMFLALAGMGLATGEEIRVAVTRTWLRLDSQDGAVARRRLADLPLA